MTTTTDPLHNLTFTDLPNESPADLQKLVDDAAGRMAEQEAALKEHILRQFGVDESNAHEVVQIVKPGEHDALTMPGGVFRFKGAPWASGEVEIRHEDIFSPQTHTSPQNPL